MAENAPSEYVGQHTPCKLLSKFLPMHSKTVLEIGGNSECASAMPFIQAGAAHVTVSGLGHVNEGVSPAHEKINLRKADALKLLETFGAEAFDVVYGISILEHIPNPDLMLEQIFSVLKPGGMAYLQGSPLWSGAYGHHVWLCNWQDGTKYSYHFLPYPGSGAFNPIPDWGHLLYTPQELAVKLREQGIYPDDIPLIVNHIHYGDITNKESASAIMAAMSRSKFITLGTEITRHVLPEETLMRLRKNFPDQVEDWSIGGIGMVLMKAKT